jgi:hypothetical protein
MAAISGHSWIFFMGLGNVLCVLGKNIVLAAKIRPILVQLFAHIPSLCLINQ